MFGLRFTTKREIGLWISVIEDLKGEVDRLHRQIGAEQARTDSAINLLLAKTQGAVIERRHDISMPEGNAVRQVMDLFDEAEMPVRIGEELLG